MSENKLRRFIKSNAQAHAGKEKYSYGLLLPREVIDEFKRIFPQVIEIEKRINEEPGFQVNKVMVHSVPNLYVFHMGVGRIIVDHMFNITADLPRPDDVIASLRDEYGYALG